MKYGCIYMDPPWHTETWGETGRDRCPETRHYQTMKLHELMALPVKSMAERDCRLFMWVIDSHFEQALALGKYWGFRYSTSAFIWSKTNDSGDPVFGQGKSTRKSVEQCWLFLKGRLNRLDGSVRQLIEAPVREHSRKPDEAYSRIERLCNGPRLELFARPPHRPGWDVWGNESINPVDLSNA